MTSQRRAPIDRAIALAAVAALCLLTAAPGAGAAVGRDGGGRPGPGHGDRDGDAARPVATRPAGQPAPPGAADALAVRGLRVPEAIAPAAAREDGIAVSFVPRAGSLVAELRLWARTSAGRRSVVSRVVAVRGGRRATVHLRADGLRPGGYEIAVRAGAGRATLGPAVTARVRVG